MSDKKLLDSLNYIDEDMVEAADSYFSGKGGKSMFRNIAAAAAGVLLIGGGIIVISIGRNNAPVTVPQPETIAEPVLQTSLPAEEEETNSVPEDVELPEIGAADEFFVTEKPADPEDETLLAFCTKKKISDPGEVTELRPSTFPEDCEIKLYEVEGEIWGFYNGKVTSTPLNRKEQTANALPGVQKDGAAGERSLISAALADYDGNGVYEVYYTTGLGENASSLMVYYPDRPAILQDDYYVYTDTYNLITQTNWVRYAYDRCFHILGDNEGRMVASGDDGGLSVYTAIAEEQDGRRVIRKGELTIDSFGESRVRESMLWKSYSRVTNTWEADPDYFALNTINMPKNVTFGMTPEDVKAVTIQLPDEIRYNEDSGVSEIDYSYSWNITIQDGTERIESTGSYTTTLSFDSENLLTSVCSKTDSPEFWEIVQNLMSARYSSQEKEELSGTAPAPGNEGSAQGSIWKLQNGIEVILVREASGEVALTCLMTSEGYEKMKEVVSRQKEYVSEKENQLSDILTGDSSDRIRADKFYTTCYPDIDEEGRLKTGYLVQGEWEDELLDCISEAALNAMPFHFSNVSSRNTLGSYLMTEVSSGTAMIQMIGDDCRLVLQVTQEGYGCIYREWHNESKERTFRQYVITDRNKVWAIRDLLDRIKADREPDRQGAVVFTTNQDMAYIFDYIISEK